MIIQNNEELLRRPCSNVDSLQDAQDIILALEQELNYANRLGKGGIGLAASQIGILKNVAIIRLSNQSINLVNANLIQGFDPTPFTNEGCLSFPGKVETTIRFQEVHITNLVEPYSFIATGFLSVVVQHELDHLNSTLFMDRKLIKPVIVNKNNRVRPNDLCPCGSKVKFKKCCKK